MKPNKQAFRVTDTLSIICILYLCTQRFRTRSLSVSTNGWTNGSQTGGLTTRRAIPTLSSQSWISDTKPLFSDATGRAVAGMGSR